MVYKSTSQDFSLVTEDYYKEEVEYQKQIDKKRNSAALEDKLKIEMLYNERKVRLDFPAGLTEIHGEILFYRPSDVRQDVKFAVNLNSENYQDIWFDELQKGLWRVKVNWEANGKEYFDEKPLIIQ
jgi:hypothetical protein